jgi:protein ImuB
VQAERDVLGSTRLDFVSQEARSLGVLAGSTVASARARCAELRVRVVAEGAVREALERVAEVAMGFGPAAAIDVARDLVWVEVGGCAHLHGGPVDGERALARALEERVRALGHACRVAVAGGPRIAAAVARFAPARQRGPFVVPEGKGAAAMRVLPIASLALDDDASCWLRDLGLATCGDLQKLPRRSLGTRLGARAHDVLQLLDGEDRAPLDVWHPPVTPEERAELEWGTSSVEALGFVVKPLCDRLAARLEGRGMAAARLELALSLDRALCDAGTAPHSVLKAALPAPMARAADLFAVLRVRIESLALPAPVLTVTLRACELAPAGGRTLDLLSPEPRADRALPRLVAELSADVGEDRIGTLALVDTWVPDERTRLVPFGARRDAPRHPLGVSAPSALEPSRLVPAVRVPVESLAGAELLARIEGVGWWRRAPRRRDLVAAWRASSLAWVEKEGTADAAWLRGWID